MTETAPRDLTGLGLMRPWNWIHAAPIQGSHRNIVEADSPEEAARQIALEQLSVLHSIGRILMWVLVIIPVVSAALYVALVVLLTAQTG
ncbi:hypothetical protein [Amycolatopsis methanolica]|uniref:Uncharacterized protein n=1 Tax=Amycolatopsis methanolica 239 TaxID=1068978 RepID=A0A076MUF8_AMYME|nr:hypothetical protein [Amycolatopsis methanolica]AIJ21472.1 hypothetical protein AMETH_1380 [Amycolatopsis methanolica 239]